MICARYVLVVFCVTWTVGLLFEIVLVSRFSDMLRLCDRKRPRASKTPNITRCVVFTRLTCTSMNYLFAVWDSFSELLQWYMSWLCVRKRLHVSGTPSITQCVVFTRLTCTSISIHGPRWTKVFNIFRGQLLAGNNHVYSDIHAVSSQHVYNASI